MGHLVSAINKQTGVLLHRGPTGQWAELTAMLPKQICRAGCMLALPTTHSVWL